MLIPDDLSVFKWLNKGTLSPAQVHKNAKETKIMRKMSQNDYYYKRNKQTFSSTEIFTKLNIVTFKRNTECGFAVTQTHTHIQVTKYNLMVICF